MISTDAVIDRLREHHVREPDLVLAADTELLESGLLDSLAVVALVAWLEDTSQVMIDPIEVVFENFQTPEAISSMMQRLNPS